MSCFHLLHVLTTIYSVGHVLDIFIYLAYATDQLANIAGADSQCQPAPVQCSDSQLSGKYVRAVLYPTGKQFNLQCKGKEEVEDSGEHLSVAVKTSTVNYWMIQAAPTFLVVCDVQEKVWYWCYPCDQLQDHVKWREQQTVSLSVRRQSLCSSDIDHLPAKMQQAVDEKVPDSLQGLLTKLDELSGEISTSRSRLPQQVLGTLVEAADALNAIHRLVEVAEQHARTIRTNILAIAQSERTRSDELMYRFDFTPNSQALWRPHHESIYDLELGNSNVRESWARADIAIAAFGVEPTPENYESLLASLAELLQVNINIEWCIRLAENDYS